jgi:hypothetical protein
LKRGVWGAVPLNLNQQAERAKMLDNLKNTYVYLIQEKIGVHAPIKIGVARSIDQRLSDLQIGNSRSLIVIAKIGPMTSKHAYGVEQNLHNKFKRFRIRGEWFYGSILKKLWQLSEDIDMLTPERHNSD